MAGKPEAEWETPKDVMEGVKQQIEGAMKFIDPERKGELV